ncbi:MAG TPA: hypothetical protein VL979_12200 [Solirubrobacteraceae bacterium]|nr:hypothetical protein [Solirubrobacteraceae bacterium]
MATRTIVTSQPDVACDVCARRLLRGEQPDVFVGAGRRRIVCELCAPRAAHAGWQRETDAQSLTLAPLRPRRGRGLFERLPAAFRARPPVASAAAPVAEAAQAAVGSYDDAAIEASYAGSPFDQLARSAAAVAAPGAEPADEQPTADHPAGEQIAVATRPTAPAQPPVAQSETQAHAERVAEYLQQALAAFNASAFPRRVAGVARSLGAPEVSVRSAEHLASVVVIVVAWELCWYRYEVDLSEGGSEAQLSAQGTELAQLAREDRLANALAVESGQLALAAAP